MLPDAEIALRLVAATLLSGIIGLERERGERAAGLRTHALVGLGSCLVMIVSAFGFEDWHYSQGALDPSRIAAQVVSGIGFLGAGVIIFQRDGGVVRGLTTAASVWVVAAIGLSVGGGMYVTGAMATAISLLILAGLKPLERRVVRRRPAASARLGLELDAELLPVRDIVAAVQDAGLAVQRVRMRPGGRPGLQELDLTYSGETAPEAFVELYEHLRTLSGVHRVTSAVGMTTNATAPNGQTAEE
ncbi:MAG: MgtC/SapB family protein [Chloroflexota bacterium]|nr:MgtC/SapB family protein [Chloroflexota bacterium]